MHCHRFSITRLNQNTTFDFLLPSVLLCVLGLAGHYFSAQDIDQEP